MALEVEINVVPRSINGGTQTESPLSAGGSLDSPSAFAGLQMHWDSCFKSRTRKIKHDKTAVLLISWHKTCDDLETSKEVNELAEVFTMLYKFDVEKEELGTSKKPEHQIKRALATFVEKHDDKHTLLIIYYAGHAWPDVETGNIKLAGQVNRSIKEEQRKRNSIAWHGAEQNIRDTDADILVIFDCCHAGYLQGDRGQGRCFEFLGACPGKELTAPPGEESFTSGLLWALRRLRETKPKGFDTVALLTKIKEAEKFPKGQYPQLFLRFDDRGDHIWIAPMTGSTDSAGNSTKVGKYKDKDPDPMEYLDLRFHFSKPLIQADILHTAEKLERFVSGPGQSLALRRIGLKGKSGRLQDRFIAPWRNILTRKRSQKEAGIGNSERPKKVPRLDVPESPEEATTPLTPKESPRFWPGVDEPQSSGS